ncbi:MAG: gliding motility-associated C-terminal domain-containing protein [Bacteroidota bacterium]
MRSAVLFTLLFLSSALFAQVEPPDFLCTRSEAGMEILRWANTSTACGPYEATEIFSATDINGPYAMIAALTDPALTEYQDANPSGQLRFYFLRYRYNCPGEVVINSDTLDNLPPLTPIVEFTGVEDNEIILSWQASTSPEVSSYRILEVLATSIIEIGTVLAPTTQFRFPFTAGNPPADERRFRLVALDACGNDSPQGTIVSPMSLAATGGTGCASDIELTIDQEALGVYLPSSLLELFVSVNGGAFTAVGTFPPNATTVSYTEANDGEDLCFYVEAELAQGGGRVRSVIACQTVAFSQPVRDFPLYGAGFTTNPPGLLLGYEEPDSAPILDEALLLINRGNELIGSPLPTPFFTGAGNFFVPLPPDGLQQGETLSLRLTDECMREVTTNEVEPVYLRGQSLFAGQNNLSWTPLINNLAGFTSYTLYRATVTNEGAAAGAMYSAIASGLTGLTFTDNTPDPDGIACYFVEANFQATGSGASSRTFIFASQIVCVQAPTEVYLPNAFSPNALEATNQVFRPFFSSLPSPDGYQLLIFDRWGGLLFSTNDPAAGWAGDSKGQLLPSGAYLYQLSYQANDGQRRQRSGVVNLLR